MVANCWRIRCRAASRPAAEPATSARGKRSTVGVDGPDELGHLGRAVAVVPLRRDADQVGVGRRVEAVLDGSVR